MKYLRIVFLVGALLLLSTSLVSAERPPHIGPAEHMEFANGDGCWMFDMDFYTHTIDDCSPKTGVYTNGATDIWHWKGKGQLPEGAALPDKTTKITYEDTGFACWAFGRRTTKYSIHITKDGKFDCNCDFWPDRYLPEE
jgi:hypothetical protein